MLAGLVGLILLGLELCLRIYHPFPPENCFLRNRFLRGQGVGFRVTAIDGGTGMPEPSAEVVVHVTHGGKTVD